MKDQLLLPTILMVLLIGCNNSNSQKTSIPDVGKLISEVESNYHNASSYSDSGKVIALEPNSSDTIEVVDFKTHFVNNGLFSFRFYKKDKSNYLYIISYDGQNNVESWWSINNQKKKHRSLSEPLAAARGISLRSSTIIPTLLFPEKTREQNILRWMKINGQIEVEILSGVNYYKLNGEDVNGAAFTMWISRKDLLIHKIEIIQKDRSRLYYEFYPTTIDS